MNYTVLKTLATFFFLLFAFHLSVNAQRITVNDLKFGLTHTLGSTEDYLLKKGLTFSSSDELSELEPIPICHSFTHNEHTSNYLNVSINELAGRIFECSSTTLKQNEYLFLRNQAKNEGYVMVSSGSDQGVISSIYVKGAYRIEFTVYKASDGVKMYMAAMRHVSSQRNVSIN